MTDITSQSLRERRRAKVAEIPRMRWLWFERDIFSGGHSIGVMWDKNLDAEEGELIYRRRIILCFAFRYNLEWY